MRRGEKEIHERGEVDAIIRSCRVCRLGMSDGGTPYVVPVCFGYEDGTVYVHSAKEGRKIDILRKNASVCVEFDKPGDLVEAPKACGFGIHFRSVIGSGTARFVEDTAERVRGLNAIMRQYTGRDFEFTEPEARSVVVLAVALEQVSGKAG